MKANKYEEVELAKIKPYWRNPRGNNATIEALKKSITDYGVVDKNYVLITGHARFKALLQLKFKKASCLVTDMDEQKVKEYRIADNKLSELATWDMNLLEQELREIKDIEGMQGYFLDVDLNSFLNDSIGQTITPISDIQIHKEEEVLGRQYSGAGNNSRVMVEIPCPHCGEPIFLDRKELEDKLNG